MNFGDLLNIDKLTEEQHKIYSSEMRKRRKSGFAAFVLWLFLGLFGGHTFYLGKIKTGILRIAILFFVIMRFSSGAGHFLLTMFVALGYSLWTFVDVVFLKKMLTECNERIEKQIKYEVLSLSKKMNRADMTDSQKNDPPTFGDAGDTPKKDFPEAEEFFSLMQFSIQKLARFYGMTYDMNMQREIKDVHTAVEQVLEYVGKNPEYASYVKKLPNQYLRDVIELLEDYIPIEQQDIMSEETMRSGQCVKNSLDGVEKYAKSLLNELYQLKHNEIRDNSKVLDRSLQMERTFVDVGGEAVDEKIKLA